MGLENQTPLVSRRVENELQKTVAEVWRNVDIPPTQFARILRNEAKVAGAYHDPAACCQNTALRDALKTQYRSLSLSRSEFARQLRTLAQGFDQTDNTTSTVVEGTAE
jgi:hypothetical protein